MWFGHLQHWQSASAGHLRNTVTALVVAAVMVACGGGDSPTTTQNTAVNKPDINGLSQSQSVAESTLWKQDAPQSPAEAARFLTQATFGPTQQSVGELTDLGYRAWLNNQFSLPLPAKSYVAYNDERNAAWMARNAGSRAGSGDILNHFWRNAITGQDQLRQRVAFALSEIFVVSFNDKCGDQNSRGMADYYDMLGRQAFGTYRDLLEAVALHPIMGCYLSHIHNTKEDSSTGRVPDENFAREIMQLFSIGLYGLNEDGSLIQGASGPALTYSQSDIGGLAKVFTGFSWDCPIPDDDGCFDRGTSYTGMVSNPLRWSGRMLAYPRYHSTSAKSFLGQTLPAQSSPSPSASLKFALDVLAQHPNVGPFIGKQLIQRLVTSNPSPAYVQRVAQAFKASNGSLRAMVNAILLDPEARDVTQAMSNLHFGKVREPVLRLSAALRALDARSDTGDYLVGQTSETAFALSQAPLFSPSVFNFFRPGYAPPKSSTSDNGLVAPELQITDEISVAGYTNYMRKMLVSGIGQAGYFGDGINGVMRGDVRPGYVEQPNHEWRQLAETPTALVNAIDQRFLYGTMSATLKQDLIDVATDIRDPNAAVRQNQRLWLTLLITLASPEFLVQR
jgi:uncharacterized protein (DUF1800 family)